MPPIFLDMIWPNYNRHVLAVISWTDLYNAMPALELGPNEINIFSNETSFMFHSGDSEGILRPPKRITSVNQCLRPTTTLQPYLPQRMLVHRMVAAESTGHYLPTLPFQSSRKKRHREPPRILLWNIVYAWFVWNWLKMIHMLCILSKLMSLWNVVYWDCGTQSPKGGSYVRIRRPLLRSFTCMC